MAHQDPVELTDDGSTQIPTLQPKLPTRERLYKPYSKSSTKQTHKTAKWKVDGTLAEKMGIVADMIEGEEVPLSAVETLTRR